LGRAFIEYDSLAPKKGNTNLEPIISILGTQVEASTLASERTAYAIDPLIAGVMLIRRDTNRGRLERP